MWTAASIISQNLHRCLHIFPIHFHSNHMLSGVHHNWNIYIILPFYPIETSSSIRHRFDIEIPRELFVEILSILKGESTWKLWHRLDVEMSTWIRLSKWTKHWWVLHMDFSVSFQRRIDVTALLIVCILSFFNIFCSGNLF